MIHSACDELEAALRRVSIEGCDKKLPQNPSEIGPNAKLNERPQTSANPKTEPLDMYLGRLHIQETAAVYGFVTNTQIKFIVVLDMSEMIITDADMKLLFKSIHSAYIVQSTF
ncbi:hypothetical protein MERGE_003157 [Pneumocystis wakefieldiae]|uniref:Uncharacterized protein n=1 Tax=Pneumocystis wakefieldiae TaxID=38082 RepID=A0A899FQ00_9ASCO|nr:hypothetical protein MERGE_003157 [Pneumocystis wakefieldiae]